MDDRNSNPDLILRGGRVTTLDRANPLATAVAISKGKFVAVDSDNDVMSLAGPDTQTIELKGRRVLPGLIDNHMHIIRGGLNFNMELRWDGVRSLADAMAMLKRQVTATPPPQWVRVVGGFSETQFVEKRLPTIDELNAVAPDTLWHRLLRRSASESGTLCRGDGGREGVTAAGGRSCCLSSCMRRCQHRGA